jgi:hypothetical protein
MIGIVIGIIVGVGTLIGFAVGVIRWLTARRSRPELTVRVDQRSLDQGIKHDPAPLGYALFLRFLVSNVGTVSARNVRIWLWFDTNYLDPLMPPGTSNLIGEFTVSRINDYQVRLETDAVPTDAATMATEVRVAVVNTGPTQIQYQTMCEPEATSEDALSLTVPDAAGFDIRLH